MSMSPETTWALVACGLIAHADGVLDGEECGRLMAVIDEEVDGDEYSEWLAMLGDRAALEAMLDKLPPPAPERAREVLEQAWSMALVDGQRCEAEIAVLDGLARRLGVDDMQLQFWREAWVAGERDFAEVVAASAAVVLGGDAAVSPDDQPLVKDLLWVLPTDDAHRDELLATVLVPGLRDDTARKLTKLARAKRVQGLQLLAPLVHAAADTDAAHARFHALAHDVGLGAKADAILRDAD
jgi:tellurite resistance protein